MIAMLLKYYYVDTKITPQTFFRPRNILTSQHYGLSSIFSIHEQDMGTKIKWAFALKVSKFCEINYLQSNKENGLGSEILQQSKRKHFLFAFVCDFWVILMGLVCQYDGKKAFWWCYVKSRIFMAIIISNIMKALFCAITMRWKNCWARLSLKLLGHY